MRYADGSNAAKLQWAYADDASGIDFTNGHAETYFIATQDVDQAGFYSYYFAWAGPLDNSETVIFALKLEEVDNMSIPPTGVTIQTSDVIVNSGRLTTTVTPLYANPNVTLSCLTSALATVESSGAVTVLANGTASFSAVSASNLCASAGKCACYKIAPGTALSIICCALWRHCTNNGVTMTNNSDWTFTLNGTYTASNANWYNYRLFPTANSVLRGLFPVSGMDGDLIFWVDYISGSITGTLASGQTNGLFLYFFDETLTEITDFKLAPKLVLRTPPICLHTG